ncbi:hypothetical protein A3460_10760 [Enterobacter roggenkampii]|nr:hypothetical protein A3460_10760 [Enterobacter roggenkampii]
MFSISLTIGWIDLILETFTVINVLKRVINGQAKVICRLVHNLKGNHFTAGLNLRFEIWRAKAKS